MGRSKAGQGERQRRGAAVVQAVLQATLELLAQVGYAALSVEAVAVAAGVNKTTVYRRWPTKAELVQEALRSEATEKLVPRSDGPIREVLVGIARGMRDLAATPRGCGLLRLLYSEGVAGELREMCERMRADDTLSLQALVRRATARGELRAGTDPEMLLDAMLAPIQEWALLTTGAITNRRLEALVDLVLYGAAAPAVTSRARRRARR